MGYLGDTYLGDVNTTSNKAIIVCRDFEYEDGEKFKFYSIYKTCILKISISSCKSNGATATLISKQC